MRLDEHEPALLALIRDEMAAGGPMTFARFMELALYAPGLGYYMRDAGRIGAAGDYYTSSNLHPLFGEMIARQLEEMAARVGTGFTVIEQGAGRGALAFDILSAQPAPWPYLIVERSPAMIERQRRLLAPWVASGRVRWIESVPDQVDGCLVSNELVDAFPVHRVVQRGGALHEVYVHMTEHGVAERLGPPSTPALGAYLDRLGVTLAEGQYAEINLAAIDWMRAAGRSIRRGFVLTIDYGHPAEELYGAHRPSGTLMAYAGHRAHEAFYERIGRQDLTSHVDFTTLAWAGRDVGLEVTGYTDQTSFLLGLGAGEAADARLAAIEDDAERDRLVQAIGGLLSPRGMGRAFKVLIQQKGVEAHRLRGLSLSSFEHLLAPPQARPSSTARVRSADR